VRRGVLVAAGLFYAAFIARSAFRIGNEIFFSLLDDAMISMRFAKHLSAGDGLVWNAGAERVEGYSNFLWTAWMAVPHAFPLPPSKVSLVVMLAGALILLAHAVVAGKVARELAPSDTAFAAFLATAAIAFSYPLVFWTLRGMEVGLQALLIDLAVLTWFRLPVRSAAARSGQANRSWQHVAFLSLLGIIPLVRDDGLISAGLIGLFAMAAAFKQRAWPWLAAIALAVALPKAAHFLFRLQYYGDLLPNTYYLKMTGAPVMERLRLGIAVATEVALRTLVIPLGLVATAAITTRWRVLRETRPSLLLAIFAANFAYSVYVGGDVWDWMKYPNRFVTVGLPPLLILAAVAAARLRPHAWRIAVVVGVGLSAAGAVDLGEKAMTGMLAVSRAGRFVSLLEIAAGLALIGMFARPRPLTTRLLGAEWAVVLLVVGASDGRTIGQWMANNALAWRDDNETVRIGVMLHAATAPETVVAAAYAGAIPYFADRPSLDITGKSDRVIARQTEKSTFRPGLNKWDYDYTVGRLRPDVVADFSIGGPDLLGKLAAWGYIHEPNGLFVRADSQRVDRACIGADWNRGPCRGIGR
jgi:arabinofuranosyltransferase